MYMNGDLVSQIKAGAVGVLPTDTVYGLVCSAQNEQAVQRLYALKSREMKPGTVVAADVEQLVALGIPRRYFTAAQQYWPAPISVVVPLGIRLPYLHQGVGSVAIRIPKDKVLHELLQQTGPLLTSSANQPGEPPANTVAQARQYFGDSVDFYEDGGDLTGKQASTIIRIVDDAVEVLRHGAVIIHESGVVDNNKA